jgi:hypothetical protein
MSQIYFSKVIIRLLAVGIELQDFSSMTIPTKLLGPEYDGINIFRIVCYNLPVDTVQQPKRLVLKISLSMPAIIHYKVKVMFYSKECS